MQRTMWTTAVFALTLLLSLPLLARPGHGDGHRGGMHGRHLAEHLAERLDLSEDQRARWQALREEHRATAAPLFEQMRSQRAEVRELLDTGGADPAAVGRLVIDTHQLHERLQTSREAMEQAFRDLLTAEQREIFDDLQARRDERGQRRGRRGPGGRGFGGPGHGL